MGDRARRTGIFSCLECTSTEPQTSPVLSIDHRFPSLRFQLIVLGSISFLYTFVLLCPLNGTCKMCVYGRTYIGSTENSGCKELNCKIGAVTSLMFPLTVVSVYLHLPALRRTLQGKILICYLLSDILHYFKLIEQSFGENFDVWIKNLVGQLRIYKTFRFMSFTWLSLMCFEMWSRFCTSRRLSMIPKSKPKPHLRRFIVYSLIGCGDPILLVAISGYMGPANNTELFLSCTNSSHFQWDVGDHNNTGNNNTESFLCKHCSLDVDDIINGSETGTPTDIPHSQLLKAQYGKTDNLLVLALCTLLKVAVNLVMFIFTAIKIHQGIRPRRAPPESVATKWLKVIRLGLLMGLDWAIGTVGSVVPLVFHEDKTAVRLFSIIFQQKGILLFVFLVCRKRVYDLLRKKWCPAQEQRRAIAQKREVIELVDRSRF